MLRKRITRRQFLGAAAAAAAVTGGVATGLHRSRSKRNAILIIADSMRRDALGCYGGQWCKTPNLDTFARRAVRCENAYLCSFPTVPARRDILAGTYTFSQQPAWLTTLTDKTVTLQKVLRSGGVYTALIADTPSPYHPDANFQVNFDHVTIHRGQENDPYRVNNLPVHLPCSPNKLRGGTAPITQYLHNVADRRTEEDYFCARTMRSAASWLEKNHGRQPFFLCVDTYDPHEPWDPPASYVRRYDPGYHGEEVIYPRYDHWRDFLSERELRHCRALYAGETTLADHWIGHLLQTIEKLGLLDNTLVLFASDHGIFLGEHSYIGKLVLRPGQWQCLPLYGELCRIPLLAHYPGCQAGTVVDGLIQPIHIGPTVLDYFGIAAPRAFQAPSAWPLLQGKTARIADVVVASPMLTHFGPTPHFATDRATVTDGRWLLVVGPSAPTRPFRGDVADDDEPPQYAPLTHERLMPELYDLKTDPGCLQNVFDHNEALAQDLQRHLVRLLERNTLSDELPMAFEHFHARQRI